MEDSVSVCLGCGSKRKKSARTGKKESLGQPFEIKKPELTVQTEPEDRRLGMSVFLGLAAAVISSLLWYGAVVITNYELGIVAVAIGWLVASAVVWGAGGNRGPVYQIIAVLCIILAMGLSEYLILRHFVAIELAKEGIESVPLFMPLKVIIELIWLGIKESPLTVVFWAIAVFEGYRIPSKSSREEESQEEEDKETEAEEENGDDDVKGESGG